MGADTVAITPDDEDKENMPKTQEEEENLNKYPR